MHSRTTQSSTVLCFLGSLAYYRNIYTASFDRPTLLARRWSSSFSMKIAVIMTDRKPRMKKAIVLGSSSGIGRTVASALGQRGYAVGLAGRRVELMAQLQAEIPTPTWVRGVDLSCPAEARRELAALIAEMGGVDLVVINAGLGTP